MTSAYVLIAAILLLGGAIAVLGDRLGTKIGKARLRLFNLRPRHTAIFVTILTGTTIAASTLGILFALSKSLRQGIFRLDDILTELNTVQVELTDLSEEKDRVTGDLREANLERQRVEAGLAVVQRRFEETSRQARELGAEVMELRQQRQTLLEQIPILQTQVRERDRTIRDRNLEIDRQGRVLSARESSLRRLQSQRRNLQTEIGRRDSRIRSLDETIAERTLALRESELNLENLGNQLNFLRRIVTDLEEDYNRLRLGRVAIARGEVLSFGVFRVVEPSAARRALDELLRQANRQAVDAIRRPLGPEEPVEERVVLIAQEQVDQMVEQIQDGREYVVRILSAGNYIQGDHFVRVFAEVTPNETVFARSQVIATVSLESDALTVAERKERLETLLAASQFRARRAGILGEILIGDGSVTTFTNFIERLNDPGHEFGQLKAIAATAAPVAGPLRLNLLALDRQGQLMFSSEGEEPPPSPPVEPRFLLPDD